jgi:hypothetical protein
VPSQTVLELPSFDTGQYVGAEFHMVAGDATLVIEVSEMPRISIMFRRVRWHRFTSIYACPANWVEEAYFRMVEVPPSESLAKFIASDQATVKPYSELHHYRILLDETGCHEVYAESMQAS